jgi:hypothetical protein
VLGRAAFLLATIACSACIGVSLAQADTAVIPDTDSLPWTDPTHQSPLEVLASQIASSLAGRPVRAYCNGQTDWDTLAHNVGFDGSIVWGYVASPRYWYPTLRTFAEDSTYTQLATNACDRLWQFAKATTKPTRCPAYRAVTETKRVKVRYRRTAPMKVRRRAKLKGHWVIRTATTKRLVWQTRVETRTTTRQEQVGYLPCYSETDDDVTLSPFSGGTQGYSEFVFAIETLAHESGHLLDFTSGKPAISSKAVRESRAECFGMQNIARVATALGASPDDGANMQRWYWENYYPTRQTQLPDYWSPDCRADGPLDASPGDGVWP